MIKEFTITKQISKQGAQTMIIIPTFLRDRLKSKTLVEAKILEDEKWARQIYLQY